MICAYFSWHFSTKDNKKKKSLKIVFIFWIFQRFSLMRMKHATSLALNTHSHTHTLIHRTYVDVCALWTEGPNCQRPVTMDGQDRENRIEKEEEEKNGIKSAYHVHFHKRRSMQRTRRQSRAGQDCEICMLGRERIWQHLHNIATRPRISPCCSTTLPLSI